MTACIVGWAHSRFGKLEGEDIESLIVRGRGRRDPRRRHRARRHRRDLRRHLQRRLRAPGISVLAGAAARSGAALQAGDAGRECLRHRLGRDPSGLERHRRAARAHRAGRRRREDDRGHRRRRSATSSSAPPICSEEGDIEGGFAGVFGRIAQAYFQRYGDKIRRARPDRRQEPQERRRQSAGADAEGSRLRVLPHRVGQEPAGGGAAAAHRLLAGLGRRGGAGAGRRRHRARVRARRWCSAPPSRSTISCR